MESLESCWIISHAIYYSDFLNKIYTIEPADVLRVAQKYFDLEKFTIAIVGDGFSDNA